MLHSGQSERGGWGQRERNSPQAQSYKIASWCDTRITLITKKYIVLCTRKPGLLAPSWMLPASLLISSSHIYSRDSGLVSPRQTKDSMEDNHSLCMHERRIMSISHAHPEKGTLSKVALVTNYISSSPEPFASKALNLITLHNVQFSLG